MQNSSEDLRIRDGIQAIIDRDMPGWTLMKSSDPEKRLKGNEHKTGSYLVSITNRAGSLVKVIEISAGRVNGVQG